MRRPRKIAIKLVLFVLLGAIINVAVAWGCILFSPIHFCEDVLVSGWFRSTTDVRCEAHKGPGITIIGFGGITSVVEPSAICGMPCRAMENRFGRPREWIDRIAFPTIATWYDDDFEVRYLPLHPLWPGFAINTIFYAAILWIVFAVPGTLKRARRRMKGRCLHCGYDLRGQPPDSTKCPECGRSAL